MEPVVTGRLISGFGRIKQVRFAHACDAQTLIKCHFAPEHCGMLHAADASGLQPCSYT